MVWNPAVVNVGDVPTIAVNISALDNATATLDATTGSMEDSAEVLMKQWEGLDQHYQTSHTDKAIKTVARVPYGVVDVRNNVWEMVWVLERFASELRDCESYRAGVIAQIKEFRAKSWVAEKALSPVFGEYWENLALYRAAADVKRRVRNAEQRCATGLACITMDVRDGDPYEGVERIFRYHNRIDFLHDGMAVDVADIDGRLFGFGDVVNGGHVSQGKLGNCWFLSSLAAIADKDPDAIRNMVRENPDGSYSVSLFIDGEWQSIRVTSEMLVDDNGRPVFANRGPGGNAPIWPLIVEKAAIAAHGGDYTQLVAGTGDKAMEMLTGNPASLDVISPNNPFGSIADLAERSQEPGVIMTANSKVWFSNDTSDVEALDTAGNEMTVRFSNNHVYQVQSIDTDGNVTIVNPHNSHLPSGGVDHDQFVLTEDQFKELFIGLSVGATR